MAASTYASTIRSLAVGKDTKCIVQGFTGKSSTFHSKLSLSVGTNIVGGVSPGKGGTVHLDRPVFNTVREAVSALKPHASAVFVPPMLAANAIIEAIEEEIPLIVSVAEGIPLHDQMKVMAALHSQGKSRLLGANSPGLFAPQGCRLGISPSIVASPGIIGIAARSGTLSYEASFATKDLGQSYIFGLGGDFYPGTRLAEVLEFFMHDKGTRGIVLVGEVGGVMEEEVADLLSSTYLNAEGMPIKPVVGFIAGRNVPPGQIFGHSGAIWRDGLSSAEQKRMIWRKSGIIVVDAIADVGEAMRDALDTRYGDFSKETPSNISSSSP